MIWCRRFSLLSVVIVMGACAPKVPPMPGPSIEASLTTYQRRVIGALTGEAEIRPGLKLANRFTPENKRAARDYIAAELQAIGLTPLRQTYGTDTENVYARITATTVNAPTVVLGAHLDTVAVAPGASDDGTGIVTVLAVARELVKEPTRTKDVIVAFFDQEERGLVGSRNFAQMLKDKNVVVESVHTVDQVGWDDNHNGAIELELPYDGAVALYKAAAADLSMTMPIWETTETGSDHTSFRRLGFKAIGITEEYRHKDTSPFIHKAGDTFATVNFPYLASTTRLMIRVMQRLVRP